MNQKQAIKAIRQAKYVFGWVVLGEDGEYIRLVKSSAILGLQKLGVDFDYSDIIDERKAVELNYSRRANVYIN